MQFEGGKGKEQWESEKLIELIRSIQPEIMINNNFFKATAGMCAFIGSEDIHYIKGGNESIIGVIKTSASNIKKITESRALSTPVFEDKYHVQNTFLKILEETKNNEMYFEN